MWVVLYVGVGAAAYTVLPVRSRACWAWSTGEVTGSIHRRHRDAITQEEALATADAELGMTHGQVDWFSTYRVHHRVTSPNIGSRRGWVPVHPVDEPVVRFHCRNPECRAPITRRNQLYCSDRCRQAWLRRAAEIPAHGPLIDDQTDFNICRYRAVMLTAAFSSESASVGRTSIPARRLMAGDSSSSFSPCCTAIQAEPDGRPLAIA